jgi:hypothetical protein
MAEYYGYVNRGSDSQVDWGAISKGLTDDIKKISSDREAKKVQLDKMNQELVNSANQLDMTDNEYVNSLVMGAANQAKELSLMNNSLLKKGVIKPSDYTTAMENMKLGVSDLSKAIKGFGPAYQKSIERLSKGEMSDLEKAEKEELFEYGNLKNKLIYLHNNGSYYITDKDENGNPVTDPSKMVGVGRLATLIGQERPVIDIPAEVEKGTKKFAAMEKFVGSEGILTSSDARNNEPNYNKAKGDFIESIISSDENVVAVLSDYLGKYRVGKRGEKGDGVISRDVNGNLLITEDQKKEARKAVDALFESQIGREIKEMPIEKKSSIPTPTKDKGEGVISLNLKRLIQGTSEEISTAISYFRSQNPNISNLVKTKDDFEITTKEGEVIQIPTSGDPTLIANQLIGWLSPGKVANPDEVVNKLGITSVSPNEGSFKTSKKVGLKDKTILYGGGIVKASEALKSIEADEDSVSLINDVLYQIDPKMRVEAVPSEYLSIYDNIRLIYNDEVIVDTIPYDSIGDQEKLIIHIENLLSGASSSKPEGTETPTEETSAEPKVKTAIEILNEKARNGRN